jgi:hypothetical protein
MILDVDFLIDFFNKYSGKGYRKEMGEQAASAPSSGGGNIPKWADSYQTKRGKANPLTKAGEKWTTGMSRGAANQIW